MARREVVLDRICETLVNHEGSCVNAAAESGTSERQKKNLKCCTLCPFTTPDCTITVCTIVLSSV